MVRYSQTSIDPLRVWDDAWAQEQHAWEDLTFGAGDHGDDETAFQAQLSALVADIVPRADDGHLDAARALLGLVAIVVEDDTLNPPPQLKAWFDRFVSAVEDALDDNPSLSLRALLTNRPQGGRPPDHAADLRSTFRHARIKRAACRAAQSLIDAGTSPTDAFTEVEAIMQNKAIVNPRRGKPYAFGTVAKWHSETEKSSHDHR